LELAKNSGLFTFANRPLNAIADQTLQFRFAFPPKLHLSLDELIKKTKETIDICVHLERTYPGNDPDHPLVKSGILPDKEELSWAHILISNVFDYYNYLEVSQLYIKPVAEKHLDTLQRIDGMREWALTYRQSLYTGLQYYEQVLAFNRTMDVEDFESRLNAAFSFKTQSLPQKAFQVVLSTGVDCVLTGARKISYIDDIVGALSFNKKIDDFSLGMIFDLGSERGRAIADKHKKLDKELYHHLSSQPVIENN